ncbi:MAG: hypothetical protein JNM84_05925 [Planctomycetes bacterium]|nr:hypothetical protein [Planctomycetota bacterium]
MNRHHPNESLEINRIPLIDLNTATGKAAELTAGAKKTLRLVPHRVRAFAQSPAAMSVAYLVGLAASTLLAPPAFAQEPEPHVHYINGPRKDAPIPRPGMTLTKGPFALVVTVPQNDFLNPKGVAWGVVGAPAHRYLHSPGSRREARLQPEHDHSHQVRCGLPRERREGEPELAGA